MLNKTKNYIPVFIVLMFAFVGSANALEVVDPTPAAAIEYNEAVTVDSSLSATLPSYFFQGTHIGKLNGEGGVLFANGTIVNISRTVEDSNPIPVTFGDDVRIDGEIWRGLYKGTAIDNMPLKISDTMVPTMDDINDLGDPGRRWQDLYMSGTLQGNDANFGGDVNFTNATFIGDIDFTDATVIGISGADLLTSENTWTMDNSFESDIKVDGKVDGVDVSNEIAVWYENDATFSNGPIQINSTYLTLPSSNPKESKVISGVAQFTPTSPVQCNWENFTVDLPTNFFDDTDTYIVTANFDIGDYLIGPNDDFNPVIISRIDRDTFKLWVDCQGAPWNSDLVVHWTAIGY